MKHKNVMALLLIVAMSMGMMAGCGTDKTAEAGSQDAGDDNAKEESSDSGETVTLTASVPSGDNMDTYQPVFDLAEEKLGIHIEVDIRPNGDDGDNLVKTRLASGDMADLMFYNTGSVFRNLNPAEYLVDISDWDVADKLDDNFKQAASVDGKLYGVPSGASTTGGIFYNKEKYEEYGLSVPKTWDEFLANCDKIKEAGDDAVIGSFADSWTAQIPYLGDFYMVNKNEPDFAKNFEAGTAKHATSEVAIKSWKKMADLHDYYNEDYLATTYDDACDKLANGEGVHYMMLSSMLANVESLYGKEATDNIGFFPIPGETEDDLGLTVWASGGIYGNKNSDKLDDVKRFMEFWVSDEALDAFCSKVTPCGTFHVDYTAENSFPAVSEDMKKYTDEGKSTLAMEFVTAVKGPNCESFCCEVGSGQCTPEEGAAGYDEDCKKQAMQLGLDWK
mgnify:CR=1 FL=1